MQRNLDFVINNPFTGEALPNEELAKDAAGNLVPLKANFVAAKALMYTYPNDTTDATTKTRRYNLGVRVLNAGDIDLSSEEITEIKTLLAQLYGPIVVGQIVNALER